jgi:hypothetical protein
MDEQVVACTLSPEELSTRGRRWLRLRDRGAVHVATIPTGLRLRFPADSRVEHELRELADLERECCGFAEWVVTAEGEWVFLDVTAEGEAVSAVQSMFASFR